MDVQDLDVHDDKNGNRGIATTALSLEIAAHRGFDIWRGFPDESLSTLSALRLRRLYWRWQIQFILRACAWCLLLLGGWDGLYSCTPRSSFAETCSLQHATKGVQAAEVISLVPLFIAYVIQVLYKGGNIIHQDKWFLFTGISLVVCLLSLFVHIVVLSMLSSDESQRAIAAQVSWVSRAVLRPVPLLHISPDVRRSMMNLLLLVPHTLGVFFVVIILTFVFGLFGRIIVLDSVVPGSDFGLEGNGFDSLYNSLVTVFWWGFGGNGPEPGDQSGEPGYKAGNFWAFYWVIYTVLQMFYVIQVVLAFVFDKYCSWASQDVAREAAFRQREACILIEFLRVSIEGSDSKISQDHLNALNLGMQSFHHFGFYPFELEIETCDDPASYVNLIVTNKKPYVSRRASNIMRLLRWVLENRLSMVIYRVSACLNAALLLLSHENNGDLSVIGASKPAADAFLLIFALAFLCDLIIAVLVYGTYPRPFPLRDSPALMRYIITSIALGITLIHACFRTEVRLRSLHLEFHSLLLLQVLDAVRIIPSVDLSIRILARVAPAMRSLILALLCAMYSWSVIGVAIHQGQLVRTNVDLQDNSSGTLFTMNFNSVFGGVYTLFMAIYGNNIQQFTAQFYITAGALGVGHFLLFYLWGTLVAANVVVSALLDVHQSIMEENKDVKTDPSSSLFGAMVFPEPEKESILSKEKK